MNLRCKQAQWILNNGWKYKSKIVWNDSKKIEQNYNEESKNGTLVKD